MTATYWEIGRRIVESEQQGRRRAGYGEALLKNLAFDLTAKFGRGFGLANLKNIRSSTSRGLKGAQLARQRLTNPRPSELILHLTKKARHCLAFPKGSGPCAAFRERAGRFPLPWSHYVRLLAVSNGEARKFYETEALRCGWSILPSLAGNAG
jgi:uncharacterized protein DUF1016